MGRTECHWMCSSLPARKASMLHESLIKHRNIAGERVKLEDRRNFKFSFHPSSLLTTITVQSSCRPSAPHQFRCSCIRV